MINISFVVPVYNTSVYLRRCIDSLLAQGKDCEIILVNDGSTDDSLRICEEYSRTNASVRVVSQENQGLAMARNTGILHARGRYIWFVDSDDWVDPGLVDRLSPVDAADAEIIAFGLLCQYSDGYSFSLEADKPGIYRGKEQIGKAVCYLDKRCIFNFATCKLYRRDFIEQNGIRFENTRFPVEDVLFNLTAFDKAQSIAIAEINPYHYMQYENSSMTRKYIPGLLDVCRRVVQERKNLYAKYGLVSPEETSVCAHVCFRQYLHGIVNYYRCSNEDIRHKRISLWEELNLDEGFQTDVKLCKADIPEAKLVYFLLKHGAPGTSDAVFGMLMKFRGKFKRIYRWVRNKILLRKKGREGD